MTDSPLSSKKYEDIVASSSALILHNRPANLPAKSVDEEQKHRLEYQQMVEAAKKKGKISTADKPDRSFCKIIISTCDSFVRVGITHL